MDRKQFIVNLIYKVWDDRYVEKYVKQAEILKAY
jgi:hypothetical protein